LVPGYEKSHGKKTNIPIAANLLSKGDTYQRLGLPGNTAGVAQQRVIDRLLRGNNSMYQQSPVDKSPDHHQLEQNLNNMHLMQK